MATVSGHVYTRKGKRGEVWYAKYRGANGQAKRALGPAWRKKGRPPEGYLTRNLAERELREILAAEENGSGSRETGATFADAAREYLRFVADVRKLDETTLSDYRGVVNGYLLEEFDDTPIERVTPDAIDAYKERLIEEGKLSNRTIVRHLTVLHGIFKRAKRKWGRALTGWDNPASADLVERPKVVYTGEFDTFDRDELERLAVAADSEQDAAMYKVAAFTGLRTGELFALRWEHVDFAGGLIHVRRNYSHKEGAEKVPKGKRVRSVPMMPAVIDVLARLKEREHFTCDGDLVFCSVVGDHLDYFDHLDRYYAALDRAKLRRVVFHDLRHAFGSAAITKLDPYAVQSYMGHQHYSTTQRYLHHKPRREDAAKLADAFASGDELGPELGPEPPTSGATERTSEHLSVPERAEQDVT